MKDPDPLNLRPDDPLVRWARDANRQDEERRAAKRELGGAASTTPSLTFAPIWSTRSRICAPRCSINASFCLTLLGRRLVNLATKFAIAPRLQSLSLRARLRVSSVRRWVASMRWHRTYDRDRSTTSLPTSVVMSKRQ